MPQFTWGTCRLNWVPGFEPLQVVKDTRAVQKELSQPCLSNSTSWVPTAPASTHELGCWRTGASQAGAGCSAAFLLHSTGPDPPDPQARLGGLPAFSRKDDYICKAPASALGWRALCNCKIMLFIEPGFIQNGIKLVFLKSLLSKTNWNLSTSL